MSKISFGVELTLEKALAAILSADVAGYSWLTGADEVGTLARLRTTGASSWIARSRCAAATSQVSILAEFGSVVDALACAIGNQRSMLERNSQLPPDRCIEFHIGTNHIFGDGVNVAARLESMTDRGGICISRQVLDQVEGKLDVTYCEPGRQNLKNIAKPVEVYAIRLDAAASVGSRFLASANLKQEIRYCKAPDGVRPAYATVGNGHPMLKSAHWLGHLEYDWELPASRQLSGDHTLIRYDARSNGLSDWDVHEISLDAWVSDMETVADAAGLNRFPLFGFSQSCPRAMTYAVRHLEPVSHLILYGGFATGANKRSTLTATDRERIAAMTTLLKQGWRADNSAFRQIFTSLLMSTANNDQADACNELQRLSASALHAMDDLTVLELLSQVMHVSDDPLVPSKLGRELAAGIPGTRFVALPGKNHGPPEQTPSVPRLFEEPKDFLRNVSWLRDSLQEP